MQVLQNQCKKQSQPVVDFTYVNELIDEMVKLCKQPLGKYPAALALAHCQVDHDDPMRFFVLVNGEVIINPKILEKEDLIKSKEGCYSYPFRDAKNVSRYNKIKVEYTNGNGKTIVKNLSDKIAHVFQHEIDHFNGKSIYN